jgi:peptidylprolyl isomerase
MSVKTADFILLEYSCSVKESGEVIETTLDSVAKEKGLHKEGSNYEPLFLVVGEGWVPKGLDERLVGLEVDKSTTIEVAPENAYGARDPSKVRLVPLRRFRTEGITPVPGVPIQIDGRAATVRSVGAGRVQVDYNHPLAGKTLVYETTVKKILEDSTEKIKAIIHRVIPSVDVEKFSIGLEEKSLRLEIPEEAFFLEGIQVLKKTIATDTLKFFPTFEKITFVETVKKPGAPSEEQPQKSEVPEKP